MHYEYAFEVHEEIKEESKYGITLEGKVLLSEKEHAEKFKYKERAALESWITIPEFLKYAISLENEKITSICETVIDILRNQGKGYHRSRGYHRIVTDKQKWAIADYLLKKDGCLKNILINIYGENIKKLFDEGDSK